jgi:hypothetical protein
MANSGETKADSSELSTATSAEIFKDTVITMQRIMDGCFHTPVTSSNVLSGGTGNYFGDTL